MSQRGVCRADGTREIKFVTDGIICQGGYGSVTGGAPESLVEPCTVINVAETPGYGYEFLVGATNIVTNVTKDVQLFATRLQSELENATAGSGLVDVITVDDSDSANVTIQFRVSVVSPQSMKTHEELLALLNTTDDSFYAPPAILGSLVWLKHVEWDGSGGSSGGGGADGSLPSKKLSGGALALLILLIVGLVGVVGYVGVKNKELRQANYSLMETANSNNDGAYSPGGGDSDDEDIAIAVSAPGDADALGEAGSINNPAFDSSNA